MEWFRLEHWSPYIVGVGIGILSCLSFVLSDHPLGCSTAFVRTRGMIEKLFRGKKVEENPYYQRFSPTITWDWMLVVGVITGAFISAILSGQFGFNWIPAKWEANAGDTVYIRWFVALVGGILMGFGARLAGGCTSGHGISGMLQLAVSSWLAAICFFIGGILTAMFIFRIVLV
ncbi:MAG: YeeE/YedE family protein [Phycisphaerae bacterium]|nr:YeeE/YedE family protein [Phycisphaerae bacterium]NIP53556.1 YeeE/YedE family protein [Phycisphaerae bacterium]NIS52520.1 YeeE/YedE family protein [Phycisphaerae bacterium]NIU07397.1 YeeE/YedE family protein [Phycisphaerae bacterium]NIU54982.1 YeeE/YedE family protein [Phycisphaerae bacterium]